MENDDEDPKAGKRRREMATHQKRDKWGRRVEGGARGKGEGPRASDQRRRRWDREAREREQRRRRTYSRVKRNVVDARSRVIETERMRRKWMTEQSGGWWQATEVGAGWGGNGGKQEKGAEDIVGGKGVGSL